MDSPGINKDNNCDHCDFTSQAYKYPLEETENFSIVADAHPLTEGHILIIPKQHLSCVGEYSQELFDEFQRLYDKVSKFVKKTYGSASSFEHGKIGQTVFHSHFHLLPFNGKAEDIVPEGKDKLKQIEDLSQLLDIYKLEGQYLFFSIEENKWVVDTSLGVPRFFRDRFAIALGSPERGNWKEMRNGYDLMSKTDKENRSVKQKWLRFA